MDRYGDHDDSVPVSPWSKMSNFDEKSGLAYCKAPWGQWAQTVEDVVIEVQLREPSSARNISCDIKPRYLFISVAGKEIIKAK